MAQRYTRDGATAPLTFTDLVTLLRGEQPLPDNRCVVYSLPLSHTQAAALVPLLQEGDSDQAPAAQRVRGLKLRGCALDDQVAEHLARVVAFNTSLRHLDLRDNAIGGVGAIHLANALRLYNHTLLDLDLAGELGGVAGNIHSRSAVSNTRIPFSCWSATRLSMFLMPLTISRFLHRVIDCSFNSPLATAAPSAAGNPANREDPDAVEEIAMLLHRNRQQQANSTPTSSPSRGGALVSCSLVCRRLVSPGAAVTVAALPSPYVNLAACKICPLL